MIDRYTRHDMRVLWSDRTRYETWLEVELAVCRAMEMEGDLVPAGTADKVRLNASIDPERILEIEVKVRHDVIAFLTHIEQQAGEPARWLHLGLTSSDVLDTAFALQLKQAGLILLGRVDSMLEVLERRARETKDVPMIGRTHGIHAEPTSVGLVFGGYYAEMLRHRGRLAKAVRELSHGKISGAVGIYTNITPSIEAAALKSLGLEPETCATQVVPRDRHAQFFCVLAQMAATLEKMAVQVRHWQRTEVGEAREAFGRGQKGSSAMPHKRNPILSENVCGLARLVRSHAQCALENVALWHERDISHSSVERVIAPDATSLVDFMLHRMTGVMDGLVIVREQMAHNLSLSGGLIYSEAVMLSLVRKGLGRQRAYELVQKAAMAAQEQRGEFERLLGEDEEIMSRLSAKELSACFDVDHHLRHVNMIFDRIFQTTQRP
ncbi:MAG: adenylosuccinate lyase [Proteobacteria bacterium]|nr:MAG: adenylosuccinate lyase [Pseudomonadota bacterium]PIE18897.1 MAG: adenylosuccinate lyase [Pseudomonadota bacterium]